MSPFKSHIPMLLLSLLLLSYCGLNAQQKKLRVLSYNVLKGLQGDVKNMNRFSNWVKKKSPDIICYQEMNGFSQKSLENFAIGYGHPYAMIAKESGYSVAITSRFPIVNAQKVLENMWHGYLYANINGLHVFAIHLSPFLYQKRLHEIRQILAQAALLPKGSPVLIAGDFNSYQARDSGYYSGKALLTQQSREQKNAEIRNLNAGKFDYSVTNEGTTAGFKDAVSLFSKQFDFSMPTKKYDAAFKDKIRIDYIWLNKSLQRKATAASVVYDDDTADMSDHYPILLDLNY